jgi:hypothetical protein
LERPDRAVQDRLSATWVYQDAAGAHRLKWEMATESLDCLFN